MINSIKLKDFQSHKDTHIEFVPGVNVIVGRSDSGKTAIFRALRWVVFNRPSGGMFVRHGRSSTEVEVDFGLSELVSRNRTVKKAGNYVLRSDVNSLNFQALSSSVPDEISEVINMGEENFQNQLDAPFLLSNTSGEISKKLNKVAQLDIIDVSLGNINRWINEIKKEISKWEDSANVEKGILKAFKGVGEVQKQTKRLVKLNKKSIELNQTIPKFENVLDSYMKHRTTVKELEHETKKYDGLVELIERYESSKSIYKEKRLRHDVFKIHRDDVHKHTLKYNRIEKCIELLRPLHEKQAKVVEMDDKINSFEQFISQFQERDDNLYELEKALSRKKLKMNEELKRINVCPTCGGKLTKEKIDKIVGGSL